jgi:hypothetical protein
MSKLYIELAGIAVVNGVDRESLAAGGGWCHPEPPRLKPGIGAYDAPLRDWQCGTPGSVLLAFSVDGK